MHVQAFHATFLFFFGEEAQLAPPQQFSVMNSTSAFMTAKLAE
jgi:hypothetical protein